MQTKTETLKNHGLPKIVSRFINITDYTSIGKVCDVDITMCKGGDNAKCNSCHRKTAKPNEYRQSYFIKPPMLSDGTCSEYWPDDAWQDPKRDRAVGQNGNTGAHYE